MSVPNNSLLNVYDVRFKNLLQEIFVAKFKQHSGPVELRCEAGVCVGREIRPTVKSRPFLIRPDYPRSSRTQLTREFRQRGKQLEDVNKQKEEIRREPKSIRPVGRLD